MVYDPIRDCDVPSPAVSNHPADAWRGYGTPGSVGASGGGPSGYFDGMHGSGSVHGMTPGGRTNGETPGGGIRPPNFSTAHHTSPSMQHRTLSASGSALRGLLNEDDTDSRRDSGYTASSTEEEGRRSSQPINRIIHESGQMAQSLSRSSVSSQPSESPGPGYGQSGSRSSPGAPQYRYHDQSHSGLLTPGNVSTGSRHSLSRSPNLVAQPPPIVTSVSPGPYPASLPIDYSQYPPEHMQTPISQTSRRQSAYAQRPMLPPDHIPRQQPGEMYEPQSSSSARHTPHHTPNPPLSHLPLRSPSISVSPRSHHQALPSQSGGGGPGSAYSLSRPPSSGGPAPPHRPGSAYESPLVQTRRLSESHSRPSSSGGYAGGRQPSLPRRTSGTSASGYPYPPTESVRSPSPILPERIPYDPHRITEPDTVLVPIMEDEVARLRALALTNNPLRTTMKRKRAAPSWSGTPGPSSGAGTKTSASTAPLDGESSYFPQSSSGSHLGDSRRRRESVSSRGRPSLTPVPDDPSHSHPQMSGHHPDTSRANGRYNGNGNSRSQHQHQHDQHDLGHGAGDVRKRGTSFSEADMDGAAIRRKVNEQHFVGNSAVASHYNSRAEVGVQQRELSPIIGLKKFNNWIKSVLIGKFAFRQPGRPGANVLDIGCGKGGDLNKWKQAKIRLYVGMDIADMSVQQAQERYNSMTRRPFEAYFYAHDCYSQPISDVLPDMLKQPDLFDNVTMQFCMHYAFESASKARMMIENVSRFLRPGGLFIGTIPDAELLLSRLEEVPEESPVLRFGNNCYFIEFEERRHKGVYGHAYRFFLQDAVDDVPEYIVHWENFVNLAMEYGLRIVYKRSFHDILTDEQHSRDFGPLLKKMGVIDEAGTSAMDADQWEAANLYMGFAFQKV